YRSCPSGTRSILARGRPRRRGGQDCPELHRVFMPVSPPFHEAPEGNRCRLPGRESLMTVRPNIVLVHGAWADGSCWSAVIERLQADGYKVTAPQFPESSLAADVARLREVLARQDGPTIVVGHSYGGQIVTALGTDAPNVVGLVYIAA